MLEMPEFKSIGEQFLDDFDKDYHAAKRDASTRGMVLYLVTSSPFGQIVRIGTLTLRDPGFIVVQGKIAAGVSRDHLDNAPGPIVAVYVPVSALQIQMVLYPENDALPPPEDRRIGFHHDETTITFEDDEE